MIHLRVIGLFAEQFVDGVLQGPRRRDIKPVVRLDEDGLAGRFADAQKERALAGVRHDQLVNLVEQLRRQVDRVQPEMDLEGVLLRGVRQRHDFLGKQLRFVLVVVHLADDEDGLARLHQLRVAIKRLVHEQHRERAVQVLDADHAVRFAGFFGNAFLHGRDHAAKPAGGAGRQFLRRDGVVQAILVEDRRKRRERMAADVIAEQLLLVRQQLALRPLRQLGLGLGVRVAAGGGVHHGKK